MVVVEAVVGAWLGMAFVFCWMGCGVMLLLGALAGALGDFRLSMIEMLFDVISINTVDDIGSNSLNKTLIFPAVYRLSKPPPFTEGNNS